MSKKQKKTENDTTESNAAGQGDVSFDNIATKFDKSIYGTTKGRLRHEMLLHNLEFVWEQLPKESRVLDAGGGTGEFTRELLKYSNKVTLNDLSADTLEVAKEKLQKDQKHPQQLQLRCGSIQSLNEPEGFDFIACHAVFEWLEHPEAVLHHLLGLLRSGGHLSVSFFNKDANLFGNMLYGNFELINNDMKQKNRLKLASHQPLRPTEVISWLPEMECEILHKAGIRCFHDYLRDKSQQSSDYEQLLTMEKKYCSTEPYMWLGKYFHLIIRKL